MEEEESGFFFFLSCSGALKDSSGAWLSGQRSASSPSPTLVSPPQEGAHFWNIFSLREKVRERCWLLLGQAGSPEPGELNAWTVREEQSGAPLQTCVCFARRLGQCVLTRLSLPDAAPKPWTWAGHRSDRQATTCSSLWESLSGLWALACVCNVWFWTCLPLAIKAVLTSLSLCAKRGYGRWDWEYF